MSNLLKIKAYAKLNLCLHVDGKLNEDFHAIRTVICPISLHDNLEVVISESSKNEVILNTKFSEELLNHHEQGLLEEIKKPSKNFVLEVCMKFLEEFNNKKQYQIKINLEKNIPLQAGLGGGTADVAAMLLLLCKHFAFDLTNEALSKRVFSLAASIGSDVVAQMQNQITYAYSKGEKFLSPKIDQDYYDFLAGLKLLIIKPKLCSDTGLAYKKLNKTKLDKLIDNSLIDAFFKVTDFSMWENDFQEVLINEHKELKEINDFLYKNGALKVLLAGSGSSIVGVFYNKQEFLNCKNLAESDLEASFIQGGSFKF